MSHDSRQTHTFSWQDPSPSMRGRAGLDYLKAMLAGEVPAAPMDSAMGLTLLEVEEGRAKFRGVPGGHHYNPMGSVHGGYASTILDSALGFAIISTLDAETIFTTLDLHVHLIRGITAATGPVTAEARLLRRGRQVVIGEASLHDGAGNLLAHATSTCILLPRPGKLR